MKHLTQAFVVLWYAHPKKAAALAACCTLLAIELAMNAKGGYQFGGGDYKLEAFGYGAVSVCIGIMGAWAALQALEERGRSAVGFVLLAFGCLAWSQSMGHSVMGVTLADGAVKRESAAMSLQSVVDELKRKEAQLAALPLGRSIGAIDAEIDLELRKTSRQYPNGDGPKAMKLKAEREDAALAARLTDEIKGLREAVTGAPQIAGGGSDVTVTAGIVDGVRQWWSGKHLEAAERTTPEDVRWWRSIFIVALLGLCATFGPAMILGRGTTKEQPSEPDWWFDPKVLPAAYRARGLPPPPDMPREAPSGDFPQPPSPPGRSQALVPSSGALNTINVYGSSANSGGTPALPPRIAARRTAGIVRT